MLSITNIITLLSLPKYGRKTVKALIDNANSEPSTCADYIDLIATTRKKLLRLPLPSLEDVALAEEKAYLIQDRCYREGIKPIGSNDEGFPCRLKSIPDPPVILYAKGDISLLQSEHAVAVIGTREPTSFGYEAGKRLSRRLATEGFTVVSGLALGCDSAGHEGCLDGNGQTIAVLAHGLDKVYPAKNKELAARILERGGLLISEYPPGMGALSNYFVERDRLQSGLSDAVLVVETGIKSGTMHTVKFCIEQGRILACLSHPPKFEVGNPKAEGNRLLIRTKGAMPIADDSSLRHFISKMLDAHHGNCAVKGVEPPPAKRTPSEPDDDPHPQYNLY